MILNWMKQRQCTTLGVIWYRHTLEVWPDWDAAK